MEEAGLERSQLLRAQVQVLEDQLLDPQQLRSLDCDALWVLRNSVYAKHGMVFRTGGRAEDFFAQQPWYEPTLGVDDEGAWERMNVVDRLNVEAVQVAEEEAGCR